MNKRTFTRDELEDLGVPYEGTHVVHTEQIDERRWYSIHELVFRAEDDGPLWRVNYFEPLTELQEQDTWNDAETIEAVQVEPYEATVTKYRPITTAPAHEPGTVTGCASIDSNQTDDPEHCGRPHINVPPHTDEPLIGGLTQAERDLLTQKGIQ